MVRVTQCEVDSYVLYQHWTDMCLFQNKKLISEDDEKRITIVSSKKVYQRKR